MSYVVIRFQRKILFEGPLKVTVHKTLLTTLSDTKKLLLLFEVVKTYETREVEWL